MANVFQIPSLATMSPGTSPPLLLGVTGDIAESLVNAKVFGE